MNYYNNIKIMFSVILTLFIMNCNVKASYRYQVPKSMNDGLEISSLQDVKIDQNLLESAVKRIKKGRFGEVHSLLIYKDNKLVLEEYFSGHDYQYDGPKHHGKMMNWAAADLHYVHSVSKSITSLCVGIAVDKGFIASVDDPIFNYLPKYQYLKKGYNKDIKIRQLLAMTSGIQWAEWNAPLSSRKNNQVAIWYHPKGPVDFLLSRPMMAAPDTWFRYSGGDIEVLAVIVENASGMSFQDFMKKYLSEPLGLESAYWEIYYPTGELHAAAGLRATPREMMKIGAMMLNNGKWKGKQIISENWVKKSESNYMPEEFINIPNETLGKCGYSYTWWTKTYDLKGKSIHFYFANGWGGQKIIVIPALNMSVVFTGANYTSKVKEFKILEKYIFPAIINL